MLSNANDPLNLEKRKIHGGQCGVCPPSYGGMWTQLHEEIRSKIQSE